MAEIEALIGRFAPFSEEREQLALALYGTSETLKLDGEGRVILSESLKRHAGIADRSLSSASVTSFRSGSRAGFATRARGGHRKGARAQGRSWAPRRRADAPGARE